MSVVIHTGDVDQPSEAEVLAGLRASMRLSFAQLLIGLVTEQWFTEADGESWLEGRLPGPVQALIDTLPQDQRFSAKARAIRPSTVLRNDPLVGLLAAAHGKTQEQLDAFFITYGAV
jgi:hypothetical protein